MELRNLISFVHVAEQKSFTRAADALGYSQSTVSFQIKQLEEELDCLLFERINHTVTLTSRGRQLLSYAHRIRSLTEDLRESLDGENDLSGHIHIVSPDSVCEEMINTHYIDFHKKYPSISIRFSTGDSSVMLDMLDHNEADIIITLDNRLYNKDYVIAKEEQLPMHFIASVSSKFAGVKELSVKDIVGEPFILTECGQGYRRAFDRELAKKSLDITPVLEIGRTDIITSMVAQSNMISYLPDFVTKPLADEGKLAYLDVCDIKTNIWKQLIYHKNKWMSKALSACIEYIKNTEFSN